LVCHLRGVTDRVEPEYVERNHQRNAYAIGFFHHYGPSDGFQLTGADGQQELELHDSAGGHTGIDLDFLAAWRDRRDGVFNDTDS